MGEAAQSRGVGGMYREIPGKLSEGQTIRTGGRGQCSHVSKEQTFLNIVLETEPSHRAASHFQDFENDTRMLWKQSCGSGFSLATSLAILAITWGISCLILAPVPCAHVRRLLSI